MDYPDLDEFAARPSYADLQARVVELETALRGLVAEIDALYGPRAHHLGCECGGTNDGVHSCGTLMAAYRAAKDACSTIGAASVLTSGHPRSTVDRVAARALRQSVAVVHKATAGER